METNTDLEGITPLENICAHCSEIGEAELSEISSSLISLINAHKIDGAHDVITQCFKVYSQSDVS